MSVARISIHHVKTKRMDRKDGRYIRAYVQYIIDIMNHAINKSVWLGNQGIHCRVFIWSRIVYKNNSSTGFRTQDKSWFLASLSWFVHFCLEFVLTKTRHFFCLGGSRKSSVIEVMSWIKQECLEWRRHFDQWLKNGNGKYKPRSISSIVNRRESILKGSGSEVLNNSI